jgi:hypothetical protein
MKCHCGFVHGCISQTKSIAVNWAKAIESTAKEKTCKFDVKSGQGIIMKKEKTETATYIGGSYGPYRRSSTIIFAIRESRFGM